MSLTYTIKPRNIKNTMKTYNEEELSHMTTYQLRQICINEKIVNGILADFDRDEFIHQILRFRGEKGKLLINSHNKEGIDRLNNTLLESKHSLSNSNIKGLAKLICYKGIATEIFDEFTIGYDKEIADTNALLMSGNEICTILNIRSKDGDVENLYITKAKDIVAVESNVKNYTIYAMNRSQSDLLYSIYNEAREVLPESLKFYMIEVLNFEVRDLTTIAMPLAIDFGTSNTTSGVYLDDRYFENLKGDPILKNLNQNDVNYLYHIDNKGCISPTIPTVIGVTRISENSINYIFGYEAAKIFAASHMEDGFSIFYDIKRFVSDPNKLEEIVDKDGHRTFIARKELIKAYLLYIIELAKQRFKCDIKKLHISAPVKQKRMFETLFQEILEDYTLETDTMLDEGVAVLYNSISEMVEAKRFEEGEEYRALIIDCGGGTTDLSSCTFSVQNKRVSYQIDINTSYENGDTDFGGNNLTYRIMQLIKISIANAFNPEEIVSIDSIMKEFNIDLFREVDKNTSSNIYQKLEEVYRKAERVVPTQFKEYEHKNRTDYYAVKNNFYYLFDMAEKVKSQFYQKQGTLRISLSTVILKEIATTCIIVPRWKLYVREDDILVVKKDIPTVYMSIFDLNLLLKADIYTVVKKFIGKLYETNEIFEFDILRLTGQSCNIELFREALKEFIPGKMIASTKKTDSNDSLYELKLICLNGAIKYLKDIKYGFADVRISGDKPAFPYMITGYTHEGEEKILLSGLGKKQTYGYLSRNMADITIKLFLKDMSKDIRYTYTKNLAHDDFIETTAEAIYHKYQGRIPQDDLDDIVEKELKFFILSEEENWGFAVVPVYRLNDTIYSLEKEFFFFETDEWVTNFFDGTK